MSDHGTTSEYRRGCRCDQCRAANTTYRNAYNERRRAEGYTQSGHPVRCAIKNCPRAIQARGLCGMHYTRQRVTGSTTARPRRPSTCTVAGCRRPAGRETGGRGLCAMHYQRTLTHGRRGEAQPRRRASADPPPECDTPDCGRAARARGLCPRCYKRWSSWDQGEPRQRQWPQAPQCRRQGCDRRPNARGLCHTHYKRVMRGIDPWTMDEKDPAAPGAAGQKGQRDERATPRRRDGRATRK